MTARGLSGLLKVGYRHAATLGAWSLTPTPRGDTLEVTTTVVEADPFWITQEPKDLWLQLGPAWWVWRAVDWSATGTCVVTGRPERR